MQVAFMLHILPIAIPQGIPLVGLGQLELQTLHSLKFKPYCVRMFYFLTSATGHVLNLLPSDPQFKADGYK